jgi:hypothetical protein
MDVFVVCFEVEVSASGWLLVQRSPTECGVSECDRATSIMRNPWPTGGFCAMQNITHFLLCVTTNCSVSYSAVLRSTHFPGPSHFQKIFSLRRQTAAHHRTIHLVISSFMFLILLSLEKKLDVSNTHFKTCALVSEQFRRTLQRKHPARDTLKSHFKCPFHAYGIHTC